MPTLFVVSTPIGNLEDVTLRALRVLKTVRLIAAEDTRHTRTLLQRYEIATPLISYHEHSRESRLEQVLAALQDGDVALVSDAGMPGISDPGYELIGACIARGIAVSVLPGPSAPVTALIVSGLPCDRYCFLGFLPRKSSERRTLLTTFAHLPTTLICFEAPHRLSASLADLLVVLGDRQIAVTRELTKLHEEVLRMPISAAIAHFQAQRPRGEFTLVIAGASGDGTGGEASDSAIAGEPSEELITERLRELRATGIKGSAAARQVAKELGISKSVAYALWVQMDAEGEEAQ